MYEILKGSDLLRKRRIQKVRVEEVNDWIFRFLLYNNRKRKLFFAGFIICIFLLQIYSIVYMDIHFTRNETRTDEALSSFFKRERCVCGDAKKRQTAEKS